MKNLAIIHYNLNRKGGSQSVAVNLANELSSFYHVSLISLRSDITTDFELNENVQFVKPDSKGRLFDGFTLNTLLKRLNTDVALFMGTGSCYCIPFIDKKIKVIVSEQSNVLNQVYMSHFKTRMNHFFSAKLAHKVVCLTEMDKKSWMDKYNLSSDKLTVIHNYFTPKPITSTKRENKIITIGSFDPVKGYDYLIEVAKLVLNETGYTWHVYAMGEGEYKDKILKEAESLEGRLIFEAPVKDLIEIYQTAKIHVMTSKNEGLPLSLIEAKSYGCVNVAFDCVTGPSEIIRNNVDGYLVDCFEVETMKQRILDLINNEDLREQFSQKGLEDLDRFNKDKVIQLWKEVIDSVLL